MVDPPGGVSAGWCVCQVVDPPVMSAPVMNPPVVNPPVTYNTAMYAILILVYPILFFMTKQTRNSVAVTFSRIVGEKIPSSFISMIPRYKGLNIDS